LQSYARQCPRNHLFATVGLTEIMTRRADDLFQSAFALDR
jgi:hypothetical protein